MFKRPLALASLVVLSSALACAQTDLQKVLERLDRLEDENRKLLEEIRALRSEVAARQTQDPAGAPLPERVAVQEARSDELAQSKVETVQKMPFTLGGMLLFNAYANGKHRGAWLPDPVTASGAAMPRSSGATVSQSVLSLNFHGPLLPGGGKAGGHLDLDFWGGAELVGGYPRVRTASLDLTWGRTMVSFAQDKPLISPREPNSLAQVAVSPLTGAGNLWDWQPQLRIEHRFDFGEHTGIRAQGSVYQTAEADASVRDGLARSLEQARPGWEGRVEFFHAPGTARFEIAPGFHYSRTHVAGASVPSHAVSLDWLWQPVRLAAFTGEWFFGQNVANMGALRQGFTIAPDGTVRAVRSSGGWAQISLFPARRWTFNAFGGEEHDSRLQAAQPGISRNLSYAANVMCRIAPNILVSLEGSQTRTQYVTRGLRLNNHYDLALAYLF